MENRYQKLMQSIHTPAGLNDRVLFEARRRVAEAPLPARRERRRGRPLLRTAVCAACALALVLGGFSLRPAPAGNPEVSGPVGGDGSKEAPSAQVLVPTFGLTAYAAMTENAYGPAEDGSIAFAAGEGCTTMEFGDFTGCLFQIAGEHIAQVKLSIDRGGLYRYQCREDLTEEQMNGYRQAMAEGRLAPAAISQRDDGTWYMPEMTSLGESVQEDYDPEVLYGFWVPPEDMAVNTGLGITTEAQMDADYFDGGTLSVTVISSDGTEKTQTYRLHSGNLKVRFAEDNTLIILPELADPNDREDLFVYGIYATPET
ncbi:MAG: hypothetical protein HFG02_06120 [Oscillibacter sp.]|nr:hypothetical protein [Oscillibacter sp.]